MRLRSAALLLAASFAACAPCDIVGERVEEGPPCVPTRPDLVYVTYDDHPYGELQLGTRGSRCMTRISEQKPLTTLDPDPTKVWGPEERDDNPQASTSGGRVLYRSGLFGAKVYDHESGRTHDYGQVYKAALSPDGRMIAVIPLVSLERELMLAMADGSALARTQLPGQPAGGFIDVAWDSVTGLLHLAHPDGTYVLRGPRLSGDETASATKLDGFVGEGFSVRDGIAYTFRDGKGPYRVDLASGASTQLASETGFLPTPSPDGAWVAFGVHGQRADGGDITDIAVVPSTGGGVQWPTRSCGFPDAEKRKVDARPGWTTDGELLFGIGVVFAVKLLPGGGHEVRHVVSDHRVFGFPQPFR